MPNPRQLLPVFGWPDTKSTSSESGTRAPQQWEKPAGRRSWPKKKRPSQKLRSARSDSTIFKLWARKDRRTSATSARRYSRRSTHWPFTCACLPTQARGRLYVASAARGFACRPHFADTRSSTQRQSHTSVASVTKRSTGRPRWRPTCVLTAMWKSSCVRFAEKVFIRRETWGTTRWSTQEKNHTSASFARKPSTSCPTWSFTCTSTPTTRPTGAGFAKFLSRADAIWRFTLKMLTAPSQSETGWPVNSAQNKRDFSRDGK